MPRMGASFSSASFSEQLDHQNLVAELDISSNMPPILRSQLYLRELCIGRLSCIACGTASPFDLTFGT
jgi:hypothetical protein